jgi:TetR/AcrR family transcriptional regulator, lmrAB and yxaGH operons repressor
MRPAKISDDKLFQELSDVFRRKGYDGASYSDLMKATGLVKASLYHRFPGGKADMVNAILSEVGRQFAEYVVKPAFEEGEPQVRARKIARRLREFYRSGKQWCLLDTVTLADSPSTRAQARRSMESWIDAFARLSRDAGLSPAIAHRRSQEAVAAIEGGLIVSRVLGDSSPFLRSLANLPRQLTVGRLQESSRLQTAS